MPPRIYIMDGFSSGYDTHGNQMAAIIQANKPKQASITKVNADTVPDGKITINELHTALDKVLIDSRKGDTVCLPVAFKNTGGEGFKDACDKLQQLTNKGVNVVVSSGNIDNGNRIVNDFCRVPGVIIAGANKSGPYIDPSSYRSGNTIITANPDDPINNRTGTSEAAARVASQLAFSPISYSKPPTAKAANNTALTSTPKTPYRPKAGLSNVANTKKSAPSLSSPFAKSTPLNTNSHTPDALQQTNSPRENSRAASQLSNLWQKLCCFIGL